MKVFIKTKNKQLSSCHTGTCDHRIRAFALRITNYENVKKNELPHRLMICAGAVYYFLKMNRIPAK